MTVIIGPTRNPRAANKIARSTRPRVMVTLTGNPALEPVAAEARTKLSAALNTLGTVSVGP